MYKLCVLVCVICFLLHDFTNLPTYKLMQIRITTLNSCPRIIGTKCYVVVVVVTFDISLFVFLFSALAIIFLLYEKHNKKKKKIQTKEKNNTEQYVFECTFSGWAIKVTVHTVPKNKFNIFYFILFGVYRNK